MRCVAANVDDDQEQGNAMVMLVIRLTDETKPGSWKWSGSDGGLIGLHIGELCSMQLKCHRLLFCDVPPLTTGLF